MRNLQRSQIANSTEATHLDSGTERTISLICNNDRVQLIGSLAAVTIETNPDPPAEAKVSIASGF